ncbi:MAG: nickel pincer cofactor biosynthesis protein LarB [Deltaproteobacteria bacterium]|nr:MAG: nickel pincer cofactor biosynthesis protein LarB [Deltaproteobacteria bacterium]
MNEETLREMLQALHDGTTDVETVLESLRSWPYEDLGFARVDHHRALRRGFPEVIFGEGKSASQVSQIMQAMLARGANILVTRVDSAKAAEVQKEITAAVYDDLSRTLTVRRGERAKEVGRPVMVLAAGTSDIPVAEEAVVTAEMMGSRVERLFDVGVAGLHRLLDNLQQMREASVLVVVAGMEGALASVVGGMVAKPIIAVPTSVGYGASFQGLAALLAMLNSCVPGVSVVNIDNGFGAGYLAALISKP